MAGQIKKMMDTIIAERSGGNPSMETMIRTKLMLKGLNPDKFTETSPDYPQIISRLTTVAQEMGVQIRPY
jgi:hypothetical protein